MPTLNIHLKSYQSKFWSDANGTLTANKDTCGAQETFSLIPRGGDKYALRSLSTGKYVRVDNFQGALLADRTEIGTTEEVTLVQTGSTIAFKGPNNQFIGAEPSGKIMANRVSLGPSNHMLLSLAPNQTLVLKQGKYVSSSYGTAVTCKADTVGTEECFKVETSEGRSAFRNAFDKYVSVEANRSVHATRSVAGLNEQFVIELHEGGCIALKSAAHRVYLGVDMSGQVVATSNKVGPSEKFVFNPHY